jgi:hypothetical protein
MFGWSRRRRDKNATCGGIVEGNQPVFAMAEAAPLVRRLPLRPRAPHVALRGLNRAMHVAGAGITMQLSQRSGNARVKFRMHDAAGPRGGASAYAIWRP